MKTDMRVLRIGIAPREYIQARTVAIARGEHKPSPEEPKVWFTSMESFAQVLSSKNQLLLEVIAKSKPASLRELAEISGRQVSNLSRTLSTMERYGLVSIETQRGRRVPKIPYDRIELDMDLVQRNSMVCAMDQRPQLVG